MGLLAWLLPDEAIVLVLVAIGFAVMVGARKAASALSILFFSIVAAPLLLPFIDLVVDAMPFWLLLIAGAWLVLVLARGLLGLAVGRQASNEVIGHVVGTGIVAAIRLLFLPLRLVFRGRR